MLIGLAVVAAVGASADDRSEASGGATPGDASTELETPELSPSLDDGASGSGDQGVSDEEVIVIIPSFASASRSAPSVTGPGGESLTYGPELAIDGRNDTAWCNEGDGSGEYLRLDLPEAVTIVGVGIFPGYDKVDQTTGEDRFEENRKIVEVTYSFPSASPQSFSLNEPLRDLKVSVLDPPVEASFVQIEPTATSAPGQRDYTCISETSVFGYEGG